MKKEGYGLLLGWMCLAASCNTETPPVPGQPDDQPSPSWQLYTTANSALPDNQINAIAIDNQDVKWVGTASGLTRIDRDNWTVYTSENSPLPSSYIQALAVAEKGAVWVGTDKGLAHFDGAAWRVYHQGNSLLPDDGVLSATHDPIAGRTWIGTAEGLVQIDRSGKWTLHDETAGKLLLSLATDRSGVLWIGSHDIFSFRGAIMRFHGGEWAVFQLDQLGYPSTFPYSIGVDQHDQVIAVLTGTAVRSVIRFKGTNWQEVSGPADAYGLRALWLGDDKIWVGGTRLSVFGAGQAASIPIPVPDAGVLDMAGDRKNDLWIGTIRDGLAVYHD